LIALHASGDLKLAEALADFVLQTVFAGKNQSFVEDIPRNNATSSRPKNGQKKAQGSKKTPSPGSAKVNARIITVFINA
jgi:hypothetical protein